MDTGGFIVGKSGVKLAVESSKVKVLMMSRDLCLPFLPSFVPSYSFILRCYASFSSVTAVLLPGADTKIFALVVELISIDVVNLYIWASTHNKFMHEHFVRADASRRILVLVVMPLPLHEPFVIFVVNNGVLAFGERNKLGHGLKPTLAINCRRCLRAARPRNRAQEALQCVGRRHI
jgi:hypothetical protein